MEEVIFPYLRSKREELSLDDDQKALLVFDAFKAQITPSVQELLDQNHSVFVLVPANLTHHFQPLDLMINSMAKRFLNKKFSDWYSDQITKQLKDGVSAHHVKIDLSLTKMKPIHGNWLIGLFDYLFNQKEVIIQSFEKIFIVGAMPLILQPKNI